MTPESSPYRFIRKAITGLITLTADPNPDHLTTRENGQGQWS